MDVSVVADYLTAKKERVRLESQVKRLGSELADVKSREDKLASQVVPDCLITAQSVHQLNDLLSRSHPVHMKYETGLLPVSLIVLRYNGNSELGVSIVFSHPMFEGWRTEKPLSYQLCRLRADAPEPPSENHIPMFRQIVDTKLSVICWERVGNELKFWADPDCALVLVLPATPPKEVNP